MKTPTLLTNALAALLAACSAGQAPPVSQTAPAPAVVEAPATTAEPIVVRPAQVRPPLPKAEPPTIKAESAIVIDTITGRILFQKDARKQRAVASTQKLLTALCVLKAGPLADPVTVEAADTKVEPSKVYIKTGETYTRRELDSSNS